MQKLENYALFIHFGMDAICFDSTVQEHSVQTPYLPNFSLLSPITPLTVQLTCIGAVNYSHLLVSSSYQTTCYFKFISSILKLFCTLIMFCHAFLAPPCLVSSVILSSQRLFVKASSYLNEVYKLPDKKF